MIRSPLLNISCLVYFLIVTLINIMYFNLQRLRASHFTAIQMFDPDDAAFWYFVRLVSYQGRPRVGGYASCDLKFI